MIFLAVLFRLRKTCNLYGLSGDFAKSRKLQKQGEDPQDIGGLAEKEAIKKVRKKYGFNKGGPVCKLAKKGKGRAYGKNS